MGLMPPDIEPLFKFLTENPDRMFLFKDHKACLTYEHDVGEVMYLIGNFEPEKGTAYNTYVAKAAKEASMN